MSPSVRALFSVLLALVGGVVADPMPFDPIRNPLNDTTDQKVRDSVLMKISRLRVNQAGYRTTDVQQGRAYVYGVGAGSAFKVIEARTLADVPGATGVLTVKGGAVSGSIKTKGSNWAGLTTGGDTRYTMASPVVSGAVLPCVSATLTTPWNFCSPRPFRHGPRGSGWPCGAPDGAL